ncbi:hypothetical protein [Carp edema virus]|nr:hypothetical protein [Carp edema virus]
MAQIGTSRVNYKNYTAVVKQYGEELRKLESTPYKMPYQIKRSDRVCNCLSLLSALETLILEEEDTVIRLLELEEEGPNDPLRENWEDFRMEFKMDALTDMFGSEFFSVFGVHVYGIDFDSNNGTTTVSGVAFKTHERITLLRDIFNLGFFRVEEEDEEEMDSSDSSDSDNSSTRKRKMDDSDDEEENYTKWCRTE